MIQGTKNLNRIPNDKYYTSKELASYVVNKTKEIIGDDNITQYLEPSAGAGVFLDLLNKDYLCYDIEPEDDRITQQNYLELKLEYLQGRTIIGNPPFGLKGILTKQFYNKSIMLGDYITFILPVSQLNNDVSLYQFDLIYSENLGKRLYSNVEVHCCLNIYRRPTNGLNRKPTYDLDGVDIEVWDRCLKKPQIEGEQLRMMAWGRNLNSISPYPDKYSYEFCYFIREDIRDKVINFIKETDFNIVFANKCNGKLNRFLVKKLIGDKFPELKL